MELREREMEKVIVLLEPSGHCEQSIGEIVVECGGRAGRERGCPGMITLQGTLKL